MWQRWVDVQGAERLVRTLLRQRHLRWAWRLWRWRVLRLQVAQRLQSQEDGRVLSQVPAGAPSPAGPSQQGHT